MNANDRIRVRHMLDAAREALSFALDREKDDVVRELAGTYSGTDTCEGFYANGQLTLTRQP